MQGEDPRVIEKLMQQLVLAREEAKRAIEERDKALEQLKERELTAEKAERASKMKSLFPLALLRLSQIKVRLLHSLQINM